MIKKSKNSKNISSEANRNEYLKKHLNKSNENLRSKINKKSSNFAYISH